MTTFFFAFSFRLTACLADDTLRLLLAKSSSRNWRSEYKGGYTRPHCSRRLFLFALFRRVVYPETSVSIASSMGSYAGGLYAHRFLCAGTPTLHDRPFFFRHTMNQNLSELFQREKIQPLPPFALFLPVLSQTAACLDNLRMLVSRVVVLAARLILSQVEHKSINFVPLAFFPKLSDNEAT